MANTADPVLSVILLLTTGYVGGLASSGLRLPRVIGMILLGVAVAPALHPSVLKACEGFPGSVSPASTMRTFALLVALARGGLSVPFKELRSEGLRLGSVAVILALVPYLAEAAAEYGAARALLPAESGVGGDAPPVVTMLAASVWAPLSPSIVIPNMLHFMESLHLKSAAGLMLTSAPFEVSAALIAFSVLEAATAASLRAGGALTAALAYIPLQIFGSALFGLALAGLYWAYLWLRTRAPAQRLLGCAAEPAERLLTFLLVFVAAYALCNESYIPKLIGLLAVLAVGAGTQLLGGFGRHFAGAPAALSGQLKFLWGFVELTLFPLTGVVIRSAIDSKSSALSPAYFAVLLVGSGARLATCLAIGALWEALAAPQPSSSGGGARPRRAALLRATGAARRGLFLWAASTPKATLQASLGPRPLAEAAKLGITPEAGAFIAQSSALAILYMTLIGSVTTYTLGRWCAEHIEGGDPELPFTKSFIPRMTATWGAAAAAAAVAEGPAAPPAAGAKGGEEAADDNDLLAHETAPAAGGEGKAAAV